MVKIWAVSKKKPFFIQFNEQLRSTKNSPIPLLKLFERVIGDEQKLAALVAIKSVSATSAGASASA
jgi:hypothetical protein